MGLSTSIISTFPRPSHRRTTLTCSTASAEDGEASPASDGINTQDPGDPESMGRFGRSQPRPPLPGDKAGLQARRLLLEDVRTVRDGGTPPASDGNYYVLCGPPRAWCRAYTELAWRC